MALAQQPPSIGRIVHYVPISEDHPESNNGADIVAAIITKVYGIDYVDSEVNLHIFTDGNLRTWRTEVKYSLNGEKGTWHYPPP